MIFLTKNINKVILIDFFTCNERSSNRITIKLKDFLVTNEIPVETFFPDTAGSLLEILNSVSTQHNGNGLIIHFIGHEVIVNGDVSKYFGNEHYSVAWSDVRQSLVTINTNTNDGLIVNTSIMCNGKNILQLVTNQEKPFFAAIVSEAKRDSQAFFHNKELYTKCLKKDRAIEWINYINEMLIISQGRAAYELLYCERNLELK